MTTIKANIIIISLFVILIFAAAFILARFFFSPHQVDLTPVKSANVSQENAKSKDSIYDVNIGFSQRSGLSAEDSKSDISKRKKVVYEVPRQAIKDFQTEQAELSSGIQQDYQASDYGPVDPASSARVSSQTDNEDNPDSPFSDLKPQGQDPEDLNVRGVILF